MIKDYQGCHWTQTPEGKEKMSRLMKAKYRSGWKRKKRNRATVAAPAASKGRLVRDEIVDLAREGAETRLARLEKEITKLRVFLGKEV